MPSSTSTSTLISGSPLTSGGAASTGGAASGKSITRAAAHPIADWSKTTAQRYGVKNSSGAGSCS